MGSGKGLNYPSYLLLAHRATPPTRTAVMPQRRLWTAPTHRVVCADLPSAQTGITPRIGRTAFVASAVGSRTRTVCHQGLLTELNHLDTISRRSSSVAGSNILNPPR